MPKMGLKSIIRSLSLPKGQKKASAKGQSHPQELEVGPHSGPYLLVDVKQIRKFAEYSHPIRTRKEAAEK